MPGEDGQLLQARLSSILGTERQSGDERTPGQKTYDALQQILRSAGGATGPRARILVRTTLSDLTEVDAAPGAPAGHFATGDPVVRAQLDRLACFAEVRRIVLDPVGVPIDLGRTRRTVSDAQYDALVEIWGGCAGMGCDRPASWCEAHHVIPWQYGGETNLRDLALLCTREHHRVHDEQQVIQLKDGRWIGPRGWVERDDTSGGVPDASVVPPMVAPTVPPGGPPADPPAPPDGGPPGDELPLDLGPRENSVPGAAAESAPDATAETDPPHRRAA